MSYQNKLPSLLYDCITNQDNVIADHLAYVVEFIHQEPHFHKISFKKFLNDVKNLRNVKNAKERDISNIVNGLTSKEVTVLTDYLQTIVDYVNYKKNFKQVDEKIYDLIDLMPLPDTIYAPLDSAFYTDPTEIRAREEV